MARTARVVIPGWPHHVTQRGNYRQNVFFSNRDRHVYLELLSKYLERFHADLISYSLMTNHVHLVIIPEQESSLAKVVGRTNNDFSRWLNVRLNRTGHLWQSRYYSCPVESPELGNVLAYVELNPVRANLVPSPELWQWSSARAHLTGVDETGLLDLTAWGRAYDPRSWSDFLRQKQDDLKFVERVRAATLKGRPLACEATLCKLESILHRPLHPRRKFR